MRILYIDIDSLRPDHLSCYGYARRTSPAIDSIAANGVRFTNCFAPDLPCAPSRMSLFSGRFGYHHGAVDHSGRRAEPFLEFADRGFRESPLSSSMWVNLMKLAGMFTTTVSPFAARHGLYTFLSGFLQTFDTGGYGHETAEQVTPTAIEWLQRHGRQDGWFLHVNYWDVHVPYRVPDSFTTRFTGEPPEMWMDGNLLERYSQGPGLRSFLDTFYTRNHHDTPQQPGQIDSMESFKRMINGYDSAIRYADAQVERLLSTLDSLGVSRETAVIVSGDHGDDLGEAGSIGHGFATRHTGRVPLLMRWPGVTGSPAGRVDSAYHYSVDMAATVLDLLGIDVPSSWDGRSFAGSLRDGTEQGREHLVVSHLAQSIQRSVLFRHDNQEYWFSRTWHDLFHCLPERLLFDLSEDPRTLRDRSETSAEVVDRGEALLQQWAQEMAKKFPFGNDPLETVMQDRERSSANRLSRYLERLRETGRAEWASVLSHRGPSS